MPSRPYAIVGHADPFRCPCRFRSPNRRTGSERTVTEAANRETGHIEAVIGATRRPPGMRLPQGWEIVVMRGT